MKKTAYGFTIVELLIVIVVIGILAAITIVAYNGVQGRASDTAIQSDMSQIAKKIQAFNATQNRYPIPDENNEADLIALGLSATKQSYAGHYAGANNLVICVNTGTTGPDFAIAAGSKSGKRITYRSDTGFASSTSALPARGTICPALGISSHASQWIYHQGAWLEGV